MAKAKTFKEIAVEHDHIVEQLKENQRKLDRHHRSQRINLLRSVKRGLLGKVEPFFVCRNENCRLGYGREVQTLGTVGNVCQFCRHMMTFSATRIVEGGK
jgi:hypothetical protein